MSSMHRLALLERPGWTLLGARACLTSVTDFEVMGKAMILVLALARPNSWANRLATDSGIPKQAVGTLSDMASL
eukprot:1508938-Pyramimonas_sp.AAC.1